MSATIILDTITVGPDNTFAFDVWYANHYLPQFFGGDRFVCLRRYLNPMRCSFLAVFEARDALEAEVEARQRPEHALVRSHERLVADYIGGRTAPWADERPFEADILYPVFFRVPAAREQEFNAWYEDEHMELLQRCAYWPMSRRYRIRDTGDRGFTHVALHYLTDLRALESPERDQARSTPWRDRLATEPWFKAEYRVYYRWGARLDAPRRSI
jgi:hypothetical protein